MANVTQEDVLAIHGGEPMAPKGTFGAWPPMDDTDRKMVMSALESNQFTVGDHYKALEREFAEWIGAAHAGFCNSGTSALHMALVGCGIGCGDEVIVPAYTFSASATCCLHHNAIPVFVDIDWDTMNLDIDQIAAAVTERTKAIIAVHLHGLTLDMSRLMAVAKAHNLKVIEDCCQAHGARYDGKRVSAFGDAAAFSCNHNKIHCAGEGGFFVSNSDEVFGRGQTLRYFGEHRKPAEGTSEQTYNAYGLGWMYRSSELVAAFARAQLAKLDGYLEQMAINAQRLTERLRDVPNLILPIVPDAKHGHNWYNYTIRFDMEALGHTEDAPRFRDRLVKAICAEGVDTGVWQGWPVPEMTAIAAHNAYGRGCPWSCTDSKVDYSLDQFPIACRHADWHTGMTFPLRPPNGPGQVERVADAWAKVMRNLDQVERIEL
jgi:dTDP-4-amino-4,6-dideoxygalactose transaminase